MKMPEISTFDLPEVPAAELRVGMFVSLGMGWLDHPFARSAFLIEDQAQLDALRALGRDRYRWDPSKSMQASPTVSAVAPARPATADPAAPVPLLDAPSASPERSGPETLHPAPASTELSHETEAAATGSELAVGTVDPRPWSAAQKVQQALRDEQLKALSTHMGQLSAGVNVDWSRLVNVARQMCAQWGHAHEMPVLWLAERGDDEIPAHGHQVTVLSLMLARTLKLPVLRWESLAKGALLHDLGKMALPRHLRYMESHFEASRAAGYRSHIELGEKMLEGAPLDEEVHQVLKRHHERFDGRGFPRGEKGSLQVSAAIVALVDQFDRLCHPSPYRMGMTPSQALAWLCGPGRGAHPPPLLAAFVRMMGMHPPGSLVQLVDGRWGRVLAVQPDELHTLTVQAVQRGAKPDQWPVMTVPQMSHCITKACHPNDLPSDLRVHWDSAGRFAFTAGPAPQRH